MLNNDQIYRLEIIKQKADDQHAFIQASLKYVKEIENKSIKKMVQQLRSDVHIDHCWIKRGNESIGVVKIFKSTFYSFGVSNDLEEEEISKILHLIESDIAAWRHRKIETTLISNYLQIALENGFKVEFSRMKMSLSLDQTKNLTNYNSLDLKVFQTQYVDPIIEMFVDAYNGGIDEKIGMFGKSVAHSAIHSVLNGKFGTFRSDLSAVIFNENKIIGGALTTIFEGHPFVVIIGVIRRNQKSGFGRKLLSWIINQTKLCKYNEIRLWVTVENNSALKLYESIGFKKMMQIYTLYK